MKTILEEGVLNIPEKAISFYREETKSITSKNPLVNVPWGLDKNDWPLYITKGLVDRNGKKIEYSRISYSPIAKERIKQGFIVEHVLLKDDECTIGCTIPINWIEVQKNK